MRAVTHVAGLTVSWDNGRFLRQRCAWCAAFLLDVDLATVAAHVEPGEAPPTFPSWPVGSLVTVDNGALYVLTLPPGGETPADACMNRRPQVGPCDWDGEAYCIEPECSTRASHRRFLGAVGEDEVVELVCCSHAETDWTTS